MNIILSHVVIVIIGQVTNVTLDHTTLVTLFRFQIMTSLIMAAMHLKRSIKAAKLVNKIRTHL